MKQGWLKRAAETAAVFAVCAGWLGTSPAHATEGYFQYGYGARQGALGGAGVADSRDKIQRHGTAQGGQQGHRHKCGKELTA